ncbi:hypothetical protein KKE92_06460 [Candidatus Micrarchaeota archaeon]|nr:hypothetical protein [Candidatus Micrarchaeota archaeon]MBU1682279.1 hypothetical protein [Candidatus Micrarchaeota archaeon]
MKKLLLILLLIGLSFATTVTEGKFESATSSSPLELVKDWKILSVAAIMISIVLVAIAYTIGIGLELPEIKAWAGNELVQIVANAIIVIMLIVSIAFIDVLIVGIVMSSNINIADCSNPSTSCLQAVTKEYLAEHISAAEDDAKNVVKNNVDAAGMASRRLGLYCLTIYCAQIGLTTTIAGNYAIDADYYAIIFEYYTNLLASMNSQLFFVEQISFNMGPIILAAGIIARAFFFTRKLGGLLIAIALGVMFFYPGMYIFDWITLETTVTGDKGLESEEPHCPGECSLAAPLAYIAGEENGGLAGMKEVYGAFSVADRGKGAQIIDGSLSSATGSNGTANGKTVISCNAGAYANCPQLCRELPYPASVSACINTSAGTEMACQQLPVECKVIRYIADSQINWEEYNKCPASCKVTPPLNSNCGIDPLCVQSSPDCRLTYNDDLDWRPHKTAKSLEIELRCALASHCNASTVATESCVFVLPRTGNCNDLCIDCPAHCRITGANPANMQPDCKEGDAIKPACVSCVESCKITIENLGNLPEDCGACPDEKRVLTPSLPNAYITGDCDPSVCPFDGDHRMTIPRNTCETCLFTEESYMYDPPINARCTDICAPSNNVPVKEPGSYTKIGEEGLVGKEEIKNIAKLILPAYLLPLFNIVATLVFIKGLSGILGGDIDIPGISKVF